MSSKEPRVYPRHVKCDGVEVELDITRMSDRWTVVEVQRDIGAHEAPLAVTSALTRARPDLKVTRVIESDQGDGIIIYEYFGTMPDGKETKVEVKFDGKLAEVLTTEWLH